MVLWIFLLFASINVHILLTYHFKKSDCLLYKFWFSLKLLLYCNHHCNYYCLNFYYYCYHYYYYTTIIITIVIVIISIIINNIIITIIKIFISIIISMHERMTCISSKILSLLSCFNAYFIDVFLGHVLLNRRSLTQVWLYPKPINFMRRGLGKSKKVKTCKVFEDLFVRFWFTFLI